MCVDLWEGKYKEGGIFLQPAGSIDRFRSRSGGVFYSLGNQGIHHYHPTKFTTSEKEKKGGIVREEIYIRPRKEEVRKKRERKRERGGSSLSTRVKEKRAVYMYVVRCTLTLSLPSTFSLPRVSFVAGVVLYHRHAILNSISSDTHVKERRKKTS